MNARAIRSLDKQIEKHMTAIAVERDRLDDLISTAEELKDHCRTAWDSLQDARDALSRLV